MRVLRALAAALAVTAALAVAACGGGDDSVSPEEAQAQAEEAAQDARQQEKLNQLEDELKEAGGQSDGDSSDSTPAPAPAPATGGSGDDCGGGVRAGPNTSCPFALNVADEYNATGGATRIFVYSPTTGETYRMTCSTGSPNACTGGNNASVYIP